METTILPPELWEIIAENWRIWRRLQQCNRHLAAVMGRIDPYRKYTKMRKEYTALGGMYQYWEPMNEGVAEVIKTTYIFYDTVILKMFHNSLNYFYDNRFHTND